MTVYDKSLLYFYLQDALAAYSDDFVLLGKENPSRLRLNRQVYSVHASYVHDSGENRTNEDEARIQIARSTIDGQRQVLGAGTKVAFVGFFPRGDVFVAWDPEHVLALEPADVASVYARQSMHGNVLKIGADARRSKAAKLSRDVLTLALPTSCLGFYLENIEQFHSLDDAGSVVKLIKLLEAGATQADEKAAGSVEIEAGKKKIKFEYTRTAYLRDPLFRSEVLAAYKNSCCICGQQLGLVEAAHIVPHAISNEPDEVSNGLGLCVVHHRLYDRALLLPAPGNVLHFNEQRASFLVQSGLGSGIEEIRSLHGKGFWVPSDPRKQPDPERLKFGLAIRLGEGGEGLAG